MKHIITIFTALVLLSLLANPAFALEYTDMYQSIGDAFSAVIDKNEGRTVFRSLYIPAGGRAEAMGSAFTALANDISFFEYNPAGSSTIENTELALFHNAWIADSAIETLAFTQRKDHLGYGGSLKLFYVPFTEYNIFGERVSRGYYTETISTANISYNFLAGYEFKGIATGINLKLAHRGVPDYTDDLTGKIINGSGLSQSALGFMLDIGMQLRFNFLKYYISREPNFNVGLSVSNLGASFTGFGKNIILDDALPTRVALGISWKPIRPLTCTLDFQQPINLQDISHSEQWAIASGMSVQFTSFFTLMSGFGLRGANPRFTLGSEFMIKTIQLNVNYTLDLSSSLNPLNRVSLSAKLNLGDRGRKAKQQQVDELYSQGLQYYVQGELEAAIVKWQEALELDKGFDPARRGVTAAREALKLDELIKKIQTLD